MFCLVLLSKIEKFQECFQCLCVNRDVAKQCLNANLFRFFQVGLSTSEAKVRDLFEHKDLGIYKNSFMAKVNPSGVIMVKLTPIHYEL